MSSEEKKIGLKVAYGYFQEGKWDRALEEYRKLERQDPVDPNLRNMLAEIQARRGAPQEALREYLECARLQATAGQHEKALATCRRALRLEPGNPGALELQHASIHARLAEAQALLDQGGLDAAHEAGQRLLDVDPADLAIHKLLDDVQAARLRQEASAASVAVLPEDGPAEAAAADPGREFVAKLFSLAESYLQAEDFDNAIESLVTILKFSPDEPAVRNRLQEVRDQLEKKRQAEEQWAQLQAEEARRLEEVKRQQLESEARSRWEREEAEARSRMESELSALQKSSTSEQDIIQRAAMEMRHKLMGGSDAVLPQAEPVPEPAEAPAPPPEPAPKAAEEKAPAADADAGKVEEQRLAEEQRLTEQQRKSEEERLARAAEAEAEREAVREAARQATLREAEALRQRFEKEALEREARYKAESEALREQVRREREEAEAAIREREAQMAQEADMLRRQIEVARLEAEAKAREAAAQEMSRRIEEEQRENEARMAREREDMLRREKEFEERMQSMMREQAARLETEVRAKALSDMKAQMEAESKARAESEQAALKREQEAMAALKAQQEAQRKAEAEARAKADAERQALDALRQAQELRKQAIIAQALQRTPPPAAQALHPGGDAAKPSRRISDALKAAANKNIEHDHAALLSSARAFLVQDLLQDAMRACQKVLEVDPENSEVKELLKEIFRKRGL